MLVDVFSQVLLLFDEVSDCNLAYKAYTFAMEEDASYDIQPYRYFTIVSILAVTSNYIIAYSALIKIRLDQGDYEPAVAQHDSWFGKLKKICFLTFLGPALVLFCDVLNFIRILLSILFAVFCSPAGHRKLNACFESMISRVSGIKIS